MIHRRPTSPAELPASIPLFPLSGALLLPYSHRPLNVFEPRYVEMVDNALAGNRLIGLIQPEDTSEESPRGRAPLLKIGTIGRLTHWEENGEGRYFIILEGLTRFEVVSELTVLTPFRQATIDASPPRTTSAWSCVRRLPPAVQPRTVTSSSRLTKTARGRSRA